MEKPKLIVVDDNQEMAKAVREMAEMSGFEVRSAFDGAGFEDVWRGFKAEVLVLDLLMPDVDGIEILRRLADRNEQPAIILMSGKNEHNLKMAYELGIAHHQNVIGTLTKPFAIANLQELLDAARTSRL